jgi:hypothetical protein
MLRSRCSSVVCLLLAVLASPACLGTGSSINAYAGARALESDDFEDVDEPTVYGADAVLKLDFPMLAVEGGWFHSEDDTSSSGVLTDVDVAFDEYFVGLRLTPWDFLIEPYGVVGFSLTEADLDASNGGVPAGDSDSAFGYYARLGAGIRLGIVRFGLDGRAMWSEDVDLDAIESDVDGYQLAAFIGLAF